MNRKQILLAIAALLFIVAVLLQGAATIRVQSTARNGWSNTYYLTHDTTLYFTFPITDTTGSRRFVWAFRDTVMAGITLSVFLNNVESDSVIIDTLTSLNVLADMNNVRTTVIRNDSLFSLWLPGGLTADSTALWLLQRTAGANVYGKVRLHVRKGSNPGTVTIIEE